MYRIVRRLFAAALCLAAVASLCACRLTLRKSEDGEDEIVVESNPNPVGSLGWATDGVTVVEDPEELSRRVAEMYEMASQEGIGVEYKNEAYSFDGVNFSCYIGNPADSSYPLFITIYSDTTYQEELFVSQLIAPGQVFEKVTFNRALDTADATLPVCYTQVYEPHTEHNDTDEFTIRAQTVITINFHVMGQ